MADMLFVVYPNDYVQLAALLATPVVQEQYVPAVWLSKVGGDKHVAELFMEVRVAYLIQFLKDMGGVTTELRGVPSLFQVSNAECVLFFERLEQLATVLGDARNLVTAACLPFDQWIGSVACKTSWVSSWALVFEWMFEVLLETCS